MFLQVTEVGEHDIQNGCGTRRGFLQGEKMAADNSVWNSLPLELSVPERSEGTEVMKIAIQSDKCFGVAGMRKKCFGVAGRE